MSNPRYNTAKIKAARLRLGWNQTKLAYKAGLSVATVSYIEGGKRASPVSVGKVARVLGLVLADLVIEDVEEAPRRKKAS